MLRAPILVAARSSTVRRVVERAPVSRGVVRRFVAGTTPDAAVAVSRELVRAGLQASLDHLGEDTRQAAQATDTVDAYRAVLGLLVAASLADRVEVSVKLTALGLDLDPSFCLDNARAIATAARAAGTTMTVDMEDHTRTEATLVAVNALRADFPDVGAVVQAQLRRTLGDCRSLAVPGSRVRLCKGAYAEPASVAYSSRADVDASFDSCLRLLMASAAYPMVATHDPRRIAVAGQLAAEYARAPRTLEYQLLYGVRPTEQRRLAADGQTVRVYVPYGQEWYGYLMRRLAERPANLTFFLRALVSRS